MMSFAVNWPTQVLIVSENEGRVSKRGTQYKL